ncbi:MAG: glycoside hydrolase [Actinomycetota bacterium]|nr:glycoside hydrolase [Actinomycetota bacterium]
MRKRIRLRHVQLMVVVLGLLVPQVVWAGNYTSDPLVQVSSVTPFASNCGTAGQEGTLYLNSEVEPWVDVNPADSDNIVGSWQQDRWSNGGARGLVAGVSFDGGDNWTESVIPGISECSGGTYERASDPWLSFSPDGSLHHVSLSFNFFRNLDNAILVNKSEDGGITWSAPKTIKLDTRATMFNDKESITADPNDSDFVYVVWDRLVFPSERAAPPASLFTRAFLGPTWFARSTDGGETYERARPIFDPGRNNQTIGNQIVVQPDGTLFDFFNLIHSTRRASLRGFFVAYLTSENHGRTWSGPQRVARMVDPFVYDPETDDPVRTGDIIPEVAVDPTDGDLYVVWQDKRFGDGTFDSIALSASTDGGQTWSAPEKVNFTPTNIPPGNQQAFTASVDVDDAGNVAITYYDFRNNTSDPNTLPTDYFIIHCHAASDCSDPDNYEDEIRLTDQSFDMRKAPFARGFFTGDYEGLANEGLDFTPFVSLTHGSDPSSVFFTRVGP